MLDIRAWLRTTQGVIAAVAGVVVVTVSLVNAGKDLYLALSNAPRTHDEATNAALFQKHFRENPALTQPFNAQLEKLVVSIELDVYRNGDVFLQVGDNGRWFPFSPFTAALWLPWTLKQAEAGGAPSGRYIQRNRDEGMNIVRERIYENGYRVTLTIDRNTGRIVSRSTDIKPLSPEEKVEIGKGVSSRPPIDIKVRP